MALSDSEREKDKKRPGRSIDAKTNVRWSDKQKLEAATTYLAIGNLAQTARLLGIPEITLRVWKASEWWNTLVEELKVQDKIVLSNKLKRIVESAHRVVEQRLDQGDPFINPKTGVIDYKPVALRDAHRVAVDMLNQATILEKGTAHSSVSEENNDNKLQVLAEKFAEFATKKIEKIKDESRTVEMADVVDVEENNNDLSGNSIYGEAERVEESQDLSGVSGNLPS